MPSPCEWLKPQDVVVRLKLSQNVVVHSCLRGGWSCTSGCDPRTPEMTGERGGHCGTDRGGTRGEGRAERGREFRHQWCGESGRRGSAATSRWLQSGEGADGRGCGNHPACHFWASKLFFFFLSLFLRLGRSREGLYIFRHKKKKKPAEFPFRKSRCSALRASAPTRADSPDGCGAVVRPLLVWSLSRHRRNKNPSGVGRVTWPVFPVFLPDAEGGADLFTRYFTRISW